VVRDFTNIAPSARKDFDKAIWALEGRKRRGTLLTCAFETEVKNLEHRFQKEFSAWAIALADHLQRHVIAAKTQNNNDINP
jgi:hypothetical protein